MDLPRSVYLHDWFLTENYFVFVLHPAFIPLGKLLQFKLGLETASEMIRWKPEEGNLVCVAPKAPGLPAKTFEANSSWVWHAFNAFEKKGNVIIDFVGASGKYVGISKPLYEVMRGKKPVIDRNPISFVRRYVISLDKSLLEEIIAQDSNYEMPFVSQSQRCRNHRFGFVGKTNPGEMFLSAISRIDFKSGNHESFRFENAYCAEPVFVPKSASSDCDEGWVLTVVFRTSDKKSSLVILNAEHLADGPVATVKLKHHLPTSFHGFWQHRD